MNQLPDPSRSQARSPLTMVQWLICIIAAIGFAFDTYVLLMNPLIAAARIGGVAARRSAHDPGRQRHHSSLDRLRDVGQRSYAVACLECWAAI